MMKAILKTDPQKGLSMLDVPVPKIKPYEVLIKVHTSAICGTDLHIYKWDSWSQKNVHPPRVIGHEFVGVVVEQGKEVKYPYIGKRVSAEGHITCGLCRHCKEGNRHLCPHTLGIGIQRDGCFAEYIAVPETNLFLVPDTIPNEIAAIFDPLGNAVHTALSFDFIGEDVLITGAGPIGLMAAKIAQHGGARHVIVTDINPYRIQKAREIGIRHAIQVPQTSLDDVRTALHIEEGFGIAWEMSGAAEGLKNILDHTRVGAKVALLGILPPETLIDWDLVIFKLLHIKGIYGREIFGTWFKMARMLESGLDIGDIITHSFPADNFLEAFETMASGNSGKVLLHWT